MTTGIEKIAAERRRQMIEEGWTPKHDAEHIGGELAMAAICYVAHHLRAPLPNMWPWDENCWKPSNSIRDLEKAGALIAAEIDRLLAAG